MKRNDFGDWVARLFYPNATEEDLNAMAAGTFDHPACPAHVDPLAQQQAQTAAQAQASSASLPCASCGSWLKPNSGVKVGGKLYHMHCATSQAQQAQQPASAMPPWGEWFAHACEPAKPAGDFGANVSGALARQREIGGTAKGDAMRVPSFEEREAERVRMAEHFRSKGIL